MKIISQFVKILLNKFFKTLICGKILNITLIGENMKDKVVLGIITNEDDVLIVKRKHKEGDLLWQFPGGKVEADETSKQAVIREIKEETGIEVNAFSKIGERIHPNTKKHIEYWACIYLSGKINIQDKNEIEDALWINKHLLNNFFTTPIYKSVAEYLKLGYK